MESQEIKVLRANLEYERTLAGYKKAEMAIKLKVHPNTYRSRERNPLDFTLHELIALQKALGAKTINDIFNLNWEGEINAKKSRDKHKGNNKAI